MAALQLPPLISRILMRRGIKDSAAARAFLEPGSVAHVAFPGMEPAVDRIRDAVRAGERICVWGDFDVDGQTSTALLVETLTALGANVDFHVPVRATEGHGIRLENLKAVLDGGARLILTCDTGINAHEAVAYAQGRGVDFIITDHHDLDGATPGAKCVINPKLLPENHPLAALAGVGVAYKLAEALLHQESGEAGTLLELVALGLIADVAYLRDETRALAQSGIRRLRATTRLGLKLLAETSRADLASLTEETIGFSIAPRLNAVGRLGDARMAVELLLTTDPVRGRVVAAQIESLNTQRRLLTDQVYQACEAQLREDPSRLVRPVLVLVHPSWPGGVVGIVAARLVERYRKPAIVFSASEDGRLHGSARSVEGVNITTAIAACRELLIEFGGHPMAAGLSIQEDHLPEFRRALEREVEHMLASAPIAEDTLSIEAWLSLGEASLGLAEMLEQLAPFGAGNHIPIFACGNLHLKSSRPIGRTGEHRSLVVSDRQNNAREVLWWNAGETALPEAEFDLAFAIRVSNFGGERRASLELQDFRPVQGSAPELRQPGPEIVDLRNKGRAAPIPASGLVWAEAGARDKGVDRFHLSESAELVIWTAPPSPADLQSGLKIVRPRIVYLVGEKPEPTHDARGFLSRLAGMAKFAVRQNKGKTRISGLAAALAQRELAVRIGLEWLSAGGHLRVTSMGDEIQLEEARAEADPSLQHELYRGVQSLIEETAAYRAYFARADPQALIRGHL